MNNKHKVFISYFHEDDQWYKENLEENHAYSMISKSVGDGEINSDIADDYIQRLIQKDYISDTS